MNLDFLLRVAKYLHSMVHVHKQSERELQLEDLVVNCFGNKM